MNRTEVVPGQEHTSSGLRIARNAGYLLVSDIGVRFISAIVSILVARYLGPEQYGMLAVALAFAGVAGYFTDLGVTQVMIREGTKPGVNIPHLLSGSLRLRIVLAAGTAALKSRPTTPAEEVLKKTQAKSGELTMKLELYEKKDELLARVRRWEALVTVPSPTTGKICPLTLLSEVLAVPRSTFYASLAPPRRVPGHKRGPKTAWSL